MTRSILSHAARLSALWMLCHACAGTETDNPVTSDQGPFESPWRFEPAPVAPGCPPPSEHSPPRDRRLWGASGDYLVGLDGGLTVLDVSDPRAPSVLARHPLHGEPRQLLVEGTDVTVVVDELPMFEQPPVRTPEALAPVTRLIRFDISEPSAPVRVAELAIRNEFWQLVPRAGSYWVMSARVVPPEPSCQLPNPYGCNYVEREALVLERYAFEAGAFMRIEQAELPMTDRAYSTEHGFAAATRTESGGVLSIARFDSSGALGATQSIVFDGELEQNAPIYIGPERTAFFAAGLQVGAATGSPLASVTTLSNTIDTRFTERGVFVSGNDPASPATFVDWSDLGALRTTTLPGVSRVLPLPSSSGAAATRALGWRENGRGATFSLLALDAGDPAVIATLDTEFIPESAPLSAQLEPAQAFLFGRVEPGARILGRVGVDSDALELDAPLFASYAGEVVSSGGWAFGLARGSVQSREQGGAGSASAELYAGVIDVARNGAGAEATLVRRIDGTLQLVVASEGTTRELQVSGASQSVLPAGDRWLVLSTLSAIECSQLGIDCDDYQPHVTVAGGDPLAVIAELPLPSALPMLGALGQAEERWSASAESGAPPIDIGAGRWVLIRDLSATCLSEAVCDSLGVGYVPFSEANVAVGQQADCPPAAPPSCSTEPLPEPTVYGSTTRRSYFVLDATTATFSESVDAQTEGDMFWQWSGPRRSRDTLLDLRIEATERIGGVPRRVRFWLERLGISSSGLTREAPLSIPGYPIALLDETTLLAAQPEDGESGRARLHRIRLEDGGVRIESSLLLDARYGDVQMVGSHAVYVRLPTTSCDLETTIEALAVDAALAPATDSARLALPGGDWRVLTTTDEQLVLFEGQGRAFARVRVGAGGELSVEAFATAPWYMFDVSWQDGVLIGVGPGGVVRLPL